MKTQQELMQAYWGPGGTVDMVKEYNAKHGCDVKPWECVKYKCSIAETLCDFSNDKSFYEFALTILYDDKRKEHRPVWEGSELYANNCTKPLTIKGKSEQWGYLSVGECTNYAISILSWNPPTPKRTFKLNDMDLPCPDKNKGGYQIALISSKHFFSDFHDAQKVANAIDEILTAARDKE